MSELERHRKDKRVGVKGLLICYFVVPVDKKKEEIRNECTLGTNAKDDNLEKWVKKRESHLNMVYASLCAGSFTFGSSRRS